MQINSRIIILVFTLSFLLLNSQDILASGFAQAEDSTSIVTTTEVGHTPDHLPSAFMVIPFVILLGMIATGPLFYHHFWEKY